MRQFLLAVHNHLLAHGKCVQAIRANSPSSCQVGIAPVCENTCFPASDSVEDIEAARKAMFSVREFNQWQLAWFTDPIFRGEYPADGLELFKDFLPVIEAGDMATICQPLDFMGFNHYKGVKVQAHETQVFEILKRPQGAPIGALEWLHVEPESLYWGPRFLQDRYGKLPYFVTENGFCSTDFVHRDGKVHDPQRIDFLGRYLESYRRLHRDGYNIAGYFLWSILDNFEWAFGYNGRFGLVHVDYESQVRTPKDSYYWYQKVIRSNGFNLSA